MSAQEHLPELHNLGNDLEEWCEIKVPASMVPKGAKLVEAYLTDKEVIVIGEPPEDESDDSHNCDAMGCGWKHVLYRFALPI